MARRGATPACSNQRSMAGSRHQNFFKAVAVSAALQRVGWVGSQTASHTGITITLAFAQTVEATSVGSSRRSILLPCTMVLQPWQKVHATEPNNERSATALPCNWLMVGHTVSVPMAGHQARCNTSLFQPKIHGGIKTPKLLQSCRCFHFVPRFPPSKHDKASPIRWRGEPSENSSCIQSAMASSKLTSVITSSKIGSIRATAV